MPKVTSASEQKRTLIKDLQAGNNNVNLKGSIYNIRTLGKKLAFVVLRDRTGFIQVVVEDKSELEKIDSAKTGTIITLTGIVQKTENTDSGLEIISPEITVVNLVDSSWPIEINKPELKENIDTQLEYRALSLRHPQQAAVFKIQGVMAQAYREYMIDNGFTEFFGPAMTASSSEGGAEIFKLDYFGKSATLAQSNQLYKQIMVGVYERVFAMQKWFRAENSNTRRHLTEGIQYEFEMGFIEDLDDIFVHIEGVISHMLKSVQEKCTNELKTAKIDLVKLPKEGGRFPRFDFKEAIQIISKITGEDTSSWDDLTTEAERELCAYVEKEYGTDFVIVTGYPKGKFYAYKDDEGNYWNFDVLCRDAEIISGGRRVDNFQKLVAEIKKEGMDPTDFSEYLSIFEFGMPPHGGFGLGFERFTMLALGLDNIRQATIFPSDTKRVASQTLSVPKLNDSKVIKQKIKELFVVADKPFSIINHEPTPTSEDSAKVRGMELISGVKALILREKNTDKNIMVAVRADKKLDTKAVSIAYENYLKQNGGQQESKSKFEFEKPEVIKEKYGLEVGAIPPFGDVLGLPTFVDSSIKEVDGNVGFNIADLRQSLICRAKDIIQLLAGIEGDFGK